VCQSIQGAKAFCLRVLRVYGLPLAKRRLTVPCFPSLEDTGKQ
jgi:hypothetical protein